MTLGIVALFPGHITKLEGQPGVMMRRRSDATCTMIECEVTEVAGRSVAQPRATLPAKTPRPRFRVQLEAEAPQTGTVKGIAIPLHAGRASAALDPEQRVLAPIYNNGRRLIFEFQSAEILFLSPDGRAEVRFVAVDPDSGQVGTESRQNFRHPYAKLAVHAGEYLNGTLDLFPARSEGAGRGTVPVPGGKADLAFHAGTGQLGDA